MANFFTDNPDLKHHLNHPLMRKIVELKERNYSDADLYDYAPLNFEDAMDNYNISVQCWKLPTLNTSATV